MELVAEESENDVTDGGGSQAPGWYYAQGDPAGTQRYWDGAQWVGGPQVAQAASEPVGYGQHAVAGGFGGGGYGAGPPAEYGSRVIAYLIDYALAMVVAIVLYGLAFVASAASSELAVLVLILGFVAVMGFSLWNTVIRQGSTGQTIGKGQQSIKLIADATGEPPGALMAFVRGMLGGFLASFCLIDLLWPLFDSEKKRLTDKILNLSVVKI